MNLFAFVRVREKPHQDGLSADPSYGSSQRTQQEEVAYEKSTQAGQLTLCVLRVGICGSAGSDIRQNGCFDDDATVIACLDAIDGATRASDYIGGDWPAADESCRLGAVATDWGKRRAFSDKMLLKLSIRAVSKELTVLFCMDGVRGASGVPVHGQSLLYAGAGSTWGREAGSGSTGRDIQEHCYGSLRR